jgi:hypothetical protein
MPRLLRNASKVCDGRKLAPVPAAPPDPQAGATIARASQATAISRLLEGARARREGKRILLLGATRKGKTTFARALVDGMLRSRVATVVLVHDQKNPDHQEFNGSGVTSVERIMQRVVEGTQMIVCRAPLTVEDAAHIVRDLVESGVPAALMIDEVTPALRVNEDTGEPVERVWCGPSPVWLALQGGGLGGSLMLNAQLPKTVPGSMVDSAEACVVFNLGGRSLEYSVDLHLIPRAAVGTVTKLVEGECCIFRADQEWDRTIYGPG